MCNPYEDAEATLIIRWNGREVVKRVKIDWRRARCLDALPNTHDLPGAFRDQLAGRQQVEDRRNLIGMVIDRLVVSVMREITEQDPVRGYSREEREKMLGEG